MKTMSVINKKPYINSVIESLEDVDLEDLQASINGENDNIFRSFINDDCPITESDEGVCACVLETVDAVYTGYLIYNNEYVVLITYSGNSQQLKMLELDLENKTYKIVDEELSINELRRLVETPSSSGEGGGGEGGGGSTETKYKHFIHLTFTDGCDGDYTIDGYVVIENTSNAQYTATTFKALFDSANIEVYGTDFKIMTTLTNQYYMQEYEDLKVCCYRYDSDGDAFACDINTYSGGLTLATISDTVSEI